MTWRQTDIAIQNAVERDHLAALIEPLMLQATAVAADSQLFVVGAAIRCSSAVCSPWNLQEEMKGAEQEAITAIVKAVRRRYLARARAAAADPPQWWHPTTPADWQALAGRIEASLSDEEAVVQGQGSEEHRRAMNRERQRRWRQRKSLAKALRETGEI